MSKAKMYGKQTKYIPNAKADMGKRKKVYQRCRGSDGSAAGSAEGGAGMRAVLASIKPRHTANIMVGLKSVELRKTGPGIVPFKVYVYETLDGGKGAGEVVCEFVCDKYVDSIFDVYGRVRDGICKAACLTEEEILKYASGGNVCGWHITNLEVYNETIPLLAFKELRRTKFGLEPYAIQRPPQSWCYVEDVAEDGS